MRISPWHYAIAALILGLVITLGLRLLTSESSFQDNLQQIQEKISHKPVAVDPRYAFRTTQPWPYPLGFSYDAVDGLVISGIVKKQELTSNGSITLQLPLSFRPQGGDVHAFLPKNETALAVLKLLNGKFESQQKWKVLPVSAITQYLQPGRQAIVYVNVENEETVNTVVQQVQRTGVVDVEPITHVIVGDFQQ